MSIPDAEGLSPAFDQPADSNYRPNRVLGILAPRQVNLIASAPSMGKWRFLLPQLDTYVRENKFLGYTNGLEPARLGLLTQFHPDKFTSLIEKLHLTALTPQTLPIIQSSFEHDHLEPIEESYSRFSNRPTVLVVDSLHAFMPSGKINDFGEVRDYCHRLLRWLDSRNLTILATVYTAKQRSGQGYERTLEKIIGSTNWVTSSGFSIVIDHPPGETDETTPMRHILFAHDQERWQESYWEFDSVGKMVRSVPPQQWRDRMDSKLAEMELNEPFRTAIMVAWAEQVGIAGTSLKQWIGEKRRDGELLPIRKGMYKRPKVC